MGDHQEPPRKVSRQERRHAERQAGKSQTLVAAGAHLIRAGGLWGELHASMRRFNRIDRGDHAARLAELANWRRLAAELQDLEPNEITAPLHAGMQRYCGEVAAAATALETAYTSRDAMHVDVANARLDAAMPLHDEIDRGIAGIARRHGIALPGRGER